MTNPNIWDYKGIGNEIKIKLSSPEKKYIIIYDKKTKTFTNKTDDFVKVVNYKVVNKKISIFALIPTTK